MQSFEKRGDHSDFSSKEIHELLNTMMTRQTKTNTYRLLSEIIYVEQQSFFETLKDVFMTKYTFYLTNSAPGFKKTAKSFLKNNILSRSSGIILSLQNDSTTNILAEHEHMSQTNLIQNSEKNSFFNHIFFSKQNSKSKKKSFFFQK